MRQISLSASLRTLPDALHRAAIRAWSSELDWSIKYFRVNLERHAFEGSTWRVVREERSAFDGSRGQDDGTHQI
ncbi:MAG: hypothetical protein GY761_14360 [Hyphomicrobiales bacterium]|nr:hypothetical protein [Hyphomicrobiales bacterium]